MIVPAIMMLVGTALLLYGLRRYIVADLGAERRGRRAACTALAEIAAAYPEARAFALAALDVASLPGDPTVEELIKAP